MLTLGNPGEQIFALAILGVFFGLWIIVASIKSVISHAMFERSRREIAAYIAEGSMSPEDGERLLDKKYYNEDEDE